MEYTIKNQSGDCSYLAADAMRECRKMGAKTLKLEKGEYHFWAETADEDICCVSNHGYNGFKRTAFSVKDMRDFTIDGNGSLLVFHGAMNAFIVNGCENVTLKNCGILFEKTLHGQFEVERVEDDFVDLRQCTPQGYGYNDTYYNHKNGLVYLENEQEYRNLVYTAEEINSDDNTFAAAEQCFGTDFLTLKTEEKEEGLIRVYNPPRKPKLHNYVVLIAAERYSNGVLFIKSKNVKAENICIHSCYGIAFHAQRCENVEISGCKTQTTEKRCFSANADATHFVGCNGKVWIHDCVFKNQLDDGVNVHGVYTKVIGKDEDSITVKYVHYQCRGIELFEDGCDVAILNSKSLIPKVSTKVKKVRVLNIESTQLFLEGGTCGIEIGDIVDSLSFYPEVVIENNKFIDNRGRGILMGSRENVLISNNYFKTPGISVKFESDSVYWYEAGGTRNVVIENNVFDDCCYLFEETQTNPWGREVIYTTPREEIEDGKYYHGKIVVRNNDFSTCRCTLADVENIEELVFENNKVGGEISDRVSYRHCKSVTLD